MKKKLLSLTLAMSMMTTMGATVFASDDNTIVETNNEVVSSTSVATLEVGVEQTFVDVDGTEIKYFLDENLMPYTIDNNEIVSLALPLEHLKITSPAMLELLNNQETETINPILARSTYSGFVSSGNWSFITPEYYMDWGFYGRCTITLSNISTPNKTNEFFVELIYKDLYNNNWYLHSGNYIISGESDCSKTFGAASMIQNFKFIINNINGDPSPSYKYTINI